MSNYEIVCSFVYDKAFSNNGRYGKKNKGHIMEGFFSRSLFLSGSRSPNDFLPSEKISEYKRVTFFYFLGTKLENKSFPILAEVYPP